MEEENVRTIKKAKTKYRSFAGEEHFLHEVKNTTKNKFISVTCHEIIFQAHPFFMHLFGEVFRFKQVLQWLFIHPLIFFINVITDYWSFLPLRRQRTDIRKLPTRDEDIKPVRVTA